MWQEPELNVLISYSYFGFQSTDLERLLEQNSCNSANLINLRNYKEKAEQEINACFLGFLNVQASTYLMYAYIYDNKEYGFVWDTGNDEILSPAANGSDIPWFLFIKQGQSFKLKIINANPYLHYITEKPFTFMNGPVLKLGSCRDAYPINDQSENQYVSK
jgi:hypothetical protein